MVSGFEIWGHDANLRRHWKLRFLAFAYDMAITIMPTVIVLHLQGVEDMEFYGIYSSFVFFLASAITESGMGASPGKLLFGFRVHAVNGHNLPFKAFGRNLNRLFWFLLPPIDWAVGMAMRGDPRQRLLDRLAGTKVVHSEESDRHKEHLEAMASEDGSDTEAIEDTGPPEDRCRECQGKLILLPDEKLQCQDCGLIQ